MEGQWVKYRGIPCSFMSSGKNEAAEKMLEIPGMEINTKID